MPNVTQNWRGIELFSRKQEEGLCVVDGEELARVSGDRTSRWHLLVDEETACFHVCRGIWIFLIKRRLFSAIGQSVNNAQNRVYCVPVLILA